MTITYENNTFRARAEAPRLILPGDDERATKNDFEKIHMENGFVDETVSELVNALGRKNWDVPNVECTFDVLGSNDKPVHHLCEIKGTEPGKKWRIRFNRPVYEFNNRRIYAAPSEFIIPEHELEIDEEGKAMYFPYVGKEWKEDEDYFHTLPKVDSKERGEERLYLAYQLNQGSFRHTNDKGREHDRVPGDKLSYEAYEIYSGFNAFLYDVLTEIETVPDVASDPYATWEKMAYIEPKPVPAGLPSFYVVTAPFGSAKTQGLLVPMDGSYMFNISDEAKEKSPTDPVLNKKFEFGFSLPPFTAQTAPWGIPPLYEKAALMKVTLQYANDIYVVDEKAFTTAHNYMTNVARDDDRILEDDENAELRQILGKTLVPLEEYKNNFERPIFLVDRPLWDNEAENVTQAVKDEAGDPLEYPEQEYEARFVQAMKNRL